MIENLEFLTRMFWPLCARWAFGSGTHAHAERACHELMHALSVRVRNWCVHCAYGPGINACTGRSPFKTCWAYATGTDAYLDHTGQELMRALSLRVRNWYARSACASEIKRCLAPPNIKVTSLYFRPKVTDPERLYGAKIMKTRAIENLKLGSRAPLKGPKHEKYVAGNCTQTNPEWVGDLRIRSEMRNFDGWGHANFFSDVGAKKS